MFCPPFCNREQGWLPGEQTLLLHMFLSKPLAELVTECPPGRARSRKLLPLFIASVSATQKQCLAISCERAALPRASHRPCFVLSPLSEWDWTWEGRITAPGAQAHPWQSAAEESVVEHRQGWTCTVCLWCKCSQEVVARMGSVQCSVCEYRLGGYRSNCVVMLIGTWQVAFCSSPLPLAGPVPETILTQFPAQKNSSTD